MSIVGFPGLEGRQEPHSLLEVPAFVGAEKHGEAASTLSRRVAGGRPLFPWQDNAMRGIMRWDPVSGLWLHATCVLIVPRQNGKSEILLFRCLYGLFVLNETIVFSVQRWKTGKKIAERFFNIVNSRPSLKRRLAKPPTLSSGQGEMRLKSGASIGFITRSPDSGTGFEDVDLIIYDESYNLTEGDKSALDPTQLAAKNPQRIFASSAVNIDIHPNGYELTALREEALAAIASDDPDVAAAGLWFAEWLAPDEMDRLSAATWRYCNPSFGIIQTDAKIRELLRGQKTQRARTVFDVNILGRGKWPRLSVDRVSLYTSEILDRAEANGAMDDLVVEHSVAIAIDRTYAGREWVIAGAQMATSHDMPFAEIGWTGEATNNEMVDRIYTLVDAWDPIVVVIDGKSPAKVLIPLLKARGIDPVVTNAGHIAIACKGVEDDLLDGELAMTSQPVLREAWESACKRTMPMGDWAWDRGEGGSAIAALVALTLALWGLRTYGLTFGGALPESPEAQPAASHDWNLSGLDTMDDFDAMAAGF